MLAGSADGLAQLILIDGDGEVVWREIYDHENDNIIPFTSIRETEGGVVASGHQTV